MPMHARVWGCRGSLATPGPATVGTGGNTSCLEVSAEPGRLVVLDAGTGIRALGDTVTDDRIDLLLTHLHLDHVEGLGFFAPLFDPGKSITIWGPRPDGAELREWLGTYLSPPFFPLRLDELPAQIEIVEVGAESWTIGEMTVRAAWMKHRGPTLAYRLEHGGGVLTYIPDNELGRDGAVAADLAHGSHVLLHDAQYTDDEYATRIGWGHSSLGDFTRFVGECDARSILMFHHDPWHADAMLEHMLAEARERTAQHVDLAREDTVLEVAAPGDSL